MELKNTVNPAVAADLVADAERVDDIAPLSEQFVLGLDDASKGHRHVGAFDGDALIGVAAVENTQAELVIAPEHRGKGHGAALVQHLLDTGVTDFWAHGDHEGAQAIARAHGMEITRELVVMLTSTLPEHFEAPEGFEVMNLEQAREKLDQADAQWLEVNNQAFSWHPEQGGWDQDKLDKAQQVQWFNSDDVLFLVDSAEGKIAGFHWLKRHTDTRGEIYVVGLSDSYRGKGLGGPLIQMGLAHLSQAGMQEVILYVEADNKPAVKAYEALDFTVIERHVVYSR